MIMPVLCLLSLLYFLSPLSVIDSSTSSISTRLLDRNGELLREVRPEGRNIPVTLSDISPFAIDALLATEDRNFYDHWGVDPRGLTRALRDNIKARRIVSGASTLSMQVARMHLGYSTRSVVNKLHEMVLAIRFEIHNSKEAMLTAWLNRAYFGNQVYGIESAAKVYFGKSALDLTNSEAAYLIGLPQNPVGYDPYRFPDNALKRHARVLEAMIETNAISARQFAEMLNVPLRIIPKEHVFKAPHFVEWILATNKEALLQHPVVYTSIDAHVQAEVEALARSHLGRLDSEYVTNASAVVLDNHTGEILAYMGSVDYWNEEHGGQNDGVRMLRQPGSTLKPFTYALALASHRFTAASVLPDIEVQIPEAGGAFAPKNYDKTYHGPVPLREALANSYNVPAVRLAREMGIPQLLSLLREAGFSSLNRAADHYGVGLTLGNGEVQMLELANAYAILAREGYPLDLTYLATTAIQPQKGSPIISPEISFLIADILSDPEAREAAFGRNGPLELPFPTAVKTGTSKDYRDNWAIGFTPSHTVAVWVGNFDGTPMQKVSGVSGAGPLFKSIMLYLGESGTFNQPRALVESAICPLSGNIPSAVCPLKRNESFLPGTSPHDTCTVHKEVLIDIRTDLLATKETPPSFTKATMFTVLPDVYHPWMRQKGMRLPPTEFSTQIDKKASVENEALGSTVEETNLTIAYPVSGMIFQLDPILKERYQKIRLEGIIPEGMTTASWWINGELWASKTATSLWPLQKGDHTIELREEGKPEGVKVHIQVVD